MRPIACSAAEIVLPSGALTTMTPRSVAALRSMLSTPTPARPTAWSSFPAAKTSGVTFVSLRTTSAWYAGMASISSSASCRCDVDLRLRPEDVDAVLGDGVGYEDLLRWVHCVTRVSGHRTSD